QIDSTKLRAHQATPNFRSRHDRWTITSGSLGAPAEVLKNLHHHRGTMPTQHLNSMPPTSPQLSASQPRLRRGHGVHPGVLPEAVSVAVTLRTDDQDRLED
ncbi:MAG: hypothetical protein ACREP9_03630, partial [Candidatus Dormibacteraceae bacterium]